LYKAWGETRLGGLPTKYRYTGQFEDSYIKLYWYGSRWYDTSLGRFTQADIIIPAASQGVQVWDRYAYSYGNPVKYIDPDGHKPCSGRDAGMNKPIKDSNGEVINEGGPLGCTPENDPFTRTELIDAINYEYKIDINILDHLYKKQLENLYNNPLQFLTAKENTSILLELIDSCAKNPENCQFTFKIVIKWENFANVGSDLELIELGGYVGVIGSITIIIGAAGIASCADLITCAAIVLLAPAVGLGALSTYYVAKGTRIYFYKEYTSTSIRFK
jgi:RHS repeat-associated protein